MKMKSNLPNNLSSNPQAREIPAVGQFHDGFVLVYRGLLNQPYFVDSKTIHLMIYLLLRANYQCKDVFIRGQIIKVKRGQLIFGRKKTSKETGLSEREIRTRLQFLRNVGFLTSKTTNRFSIITICNYNHYQTPFPRNDQQSDQQATGRRPRTNNEKERNTYSQQGTENKDHRSLKRWVFLRRVQAGN
jgi:hypothetical protein